MVCVTRTRAGWVEFTFAEGVRRSSVSSEIRNLDQIAAERRQRVEELKIQRQQLHAELDRRVEEMYEQEKILNAALAEEQEILNELVEIGQPFAAA